MAKPKTKTLVELRAAALEDLARFQKASADLTDPSVIANLLQNESDRGVVIIFVSIIEDELLKAITKKFKPLSNTELKNLTRAGAPLNSMSARTNMAVALGIVKPEMAGIIEALKAMRNACAHSRREINFATRELNQPLRFCIGGTEQVDIFENSTAYVRDAFIFVAGAVLAHIEGSEAAPANTMKFMQEVVAQLQASRRTPSEPSGPHRFPPPREKGQ